MSLDDISQDADRVLQIPLVAKLIHLCLLIRQLLILPPLPSPVPTDDHACQKCDGKKQLEQPVSAARIRAWVDRPQVKNWARCQWHS